VDVGGIDRLIHEPARLAIMAQLYVVESADSPYVMSQTGLTWGNLSSHMSKLEEAGYLQVDKGYEGRKPKTTLRLTARGRGAFVEYRRHMMGALEDVGG
jgi:DNA-binding transcriptional ArsR family regulator